MLFLPTRGDTPVGSFYIGLAALLPALVGLARRRSIGLALAGVIWFWFALGYKVSPSPFALLRELPVYATLRYPERFTVLLSLVVAVLAGRGMTTLEALRRARSPRLRRARPAASALLVILVAMLVGGLGPLVAQQHLRASMRELTAQPATPTEHRPFHQARGNRWALAYYEPMDRGSLSCWDAYPVPQSPLLRADLAEEARLADPSAGTIVEWSWSPNRIVLDVEAKTPARVLLNQNWHSGWRASGGTVSNDRGLLVVDVPEGSHEVELRFAPRSATGGAFVSLLALVAAALVLRVRGEGARAHLTAFALCAVPLVAFAACTALLPDPRPANDVSEIRSPTGEPVVVDGLLGGVERLDARFDGDVVLEGATWSTPAPAAGEEIVLELDWRRGAQAPEGLGIFVHIEPSSGDAIDGDHVLLSSVLDFGDAPEGRTLRDLVPISIPEDAAGKEWKVWVGLWRVRSGGERVKVLSPGNARVDDGRVLAATLTIR